MNLYDQRVDAMKARERGDFCMKYAMAMALADRACENENLNDKRLAAYKRKRVELGYWFP